MGKYVWQLGWMRGLMALVLVGASFSRPALAAADIVIAQVAPFTGAMAPTGKAVNAGINLYLDSVNAAGGINGRKIKLITRDDAYKPEETVRLIKELISSDNPTAFIATAGTANLDLLRKDGALVKADVAMVGGVTGAKLLIDAPNIFITKAAYQDELVGLLQSVTLRGIDKIGIVYQNDSFGKEILTGAETLSTKFKVDLVIKAPYERNTTEMSAVVNSVLKVNPPLIYLGAITNAAIDFIKLYREGGGSGEIYGLSVIDTNVLTAKLGPKIARGYAFGVVVPPTSAKSFGIVREYLALAEKAKDANLSERSMEGFISAKVLVHALRKAGKPTPAAVLEATAGLRQVDLGGYQVDFTQKNYTGSRYVDFAIIGADGRVRR